MSLQLNGDTGVTFNDASLQGSAASPFGLKNRIINGDMRIDQRNAGASVTVNSGSQYFYPVDRFMGVGQTSDGVFTLQQNTSVPTGQGFVNSIKATITTADASIGATQQYWIGQQIEGYNVADLQYGTANAKTVTLSFWVNCSVTGTFSGCFMNSASDRSYPFTYTISSANTWEQKTITIAGDTTGTWNSTNGTGISVQWSLGSGSSRSGTANTWAAARYHGATGATTLISTNAATFYITGVQLEVGSTATPFERRLYNQELANCQRYYQLFGSTTTTGVLVLPVSGFGYSSSEVDFEFSLPVQMRASPSLSATTVRITDGVNNIATNTFSGGYTTNGMVASINCTGLSGVVQFRPYHMHTNAGTVGYVQVSAEL